MVVCTWIRYLFKIAWEKSDFPYNTIIQYRGEEMSVNERVKNIVAEQLGIGIDEIIMNLAS